jgi:hypothetical protein
VRLFSSYISRFDFFFVKVGPVSKAEFLAMRLAGVQVGYGYYTGKCSSTPWEASYTP